MLVAALGYARSLVRNSWRITCSLAGVQKRFINLVLFQDQATSMFQPFQTLFLKLVPSHHFPYFRSFNGKYVIHANAYVHVSISLVFQKPGNTFFDKGHGTQHVFPKAGCLASIYFNLPTNAYKYKLNYISKILIQQ